MLIYISIILTVVGVIALAVWILGEIAQKKRAGTTLPKELSETILGVLKIEDASVGSTDFREIYFGAKLRGSTIFYAQWRNSFFSKWSICIDELQFRIPFRHPIRRRLDTLQKLLQQKETNKKIKKLKTMLEKI